MNAGPFLPPHFWALLLLCLLVFAILWWIFLAEARWSRRRALRRRIAMLEAQAAAPPLPLDLAGMRQAMLDARRAAERAPQPLRHPLYLLPWFMFVGDDQAGLETLLAAAAEPAVDSAKAADAAAGDPSFWRWRFLRSMIAIAIEPTALPDPTDPLRRARWYRALLELTERRKRLALNGLVICIGTATLLGDPEASAQVAGRLGALADDLARHLRLHLPIYLVVTGLERLEGYERVRAALPPEVRGQALGHRLRGSTPPTLSAGERLDAVFDELGRRLEALRLGLVREQPDAAGKLAAHGFVEQLRALQTPLRAAADRLFATAQGSAALRWRGVYLTGATAGGGTFVWDLFARFLPADQPIAHSQTPRAARGPVRGAR
jgi:type VI protein secretion system component VasK